MIARTRHLLIALTVAITVVIALALIVPQGTGNRPTFVDDDPRSSDDYPVVVPASPQVTYPAAGS
ncbi:MAG: hypothetical protein P8L46_03405 [Acidimicrobiales bacterium]|nr:hypothetical protein [Acidimicrobiales bacterium]MDG2217070.1 hypothetical protein [Acidimicrobiales bacterium]